MKVEIGGKRIGSGNKMNMDLKTYDRSTHNLDYLWRSSMAAGTVVPFLKELILPGDTMDFDLDIEVLTLPTNGPLFGRFKAELHIFELPIRLYQALLHNNALNIGLKMQTVKFPMMRLYAKGTDVDRPKDIDNYQVNPSCILSYLGIRGIGQIMDTLPSLEVERQFNAVTWLGYWDVIKNYYANKQEEVGYVIHTERQELADSVTDITDYGGGFTLGEAPNVIDILTNPLTLIVTYPAADPAPIGNQIILNTNRGQITLEEWGNLTRTELVLTEYKQTWDYQNRYGTTLQIQSWQYVTAIDNIVNQIELTEFPLENIDNMRNELLNNAASTAPKIVNDLGVGAPYSLLLDPMTPDLLRAYTSTQEGLAVKTYDSDKLNNWMSTEWIDGPGGISEISAIDTSAGSFTIDTLIMARKVYNMLNRIAISGGTYKDWIDTRYADSGNWMCSTPMFHGGMRHDIGFQEVISTAESQETGQPLGTLGGRGRMMGKQDGGSVTLKAKEAGYILGLVSITPMIDYSQGNDWDIDLENMDQLHAPEMDAIGFQDVITEEMAWWDTHWDIPTQKWIKRSAGKVPAWLNYMTKINKVYGNFAIDTMEGWMVLKRKYKMNEVNGHIEDLTTYIDPSKFNYAFAQTDLSSQNFWVHIGVRNRARRIMSAKVMPNL